MVGAQVVRDEEGDRRRVYGGSPPDSDRIVTVV